MEALFYGGYRINENIRVRFGIIGLERTEEGIHE